MAAHNYTRTWLGGATSHGILSSLAIFNQEEKNEERQSNIEKKKKNPKLVPSRDHWLDNDLMNGCLL